MAQVFIPLLEMVDRIDGNTKMLKVNGTLP
nr:MAG TPA: hypothetical protein [Caudoviricetes sp.]